MPMQGHDRERTAAAPLLQVPGVSPSNWGRDGVIRHEGVTYYISSEAVCYHKATGEFLPLEEGRIGPGPLCLYVDAGHVVRGIEVY